MKEYIPKDEQDRRGFEALKVMFAEVTSEIRQIPKEQRAPLVRQFDNKYVKSLYMFGKMNEDYEVCAAAKEVLEERGFINKAED